MVTHDYNPTQLERTTGTKSSQDPHQPIKAGMMVPVTVVMWDTQEDQGLGQPGQKARHYLKIAERAGGGQRQGKVWLK
jgi:hypothetical protein